MNIKQHTLQSGERILLVPVPSNITKVSIKPPKEGLTTYFHIDYDYDKTSSYTSGGFALFYKDFGGKKKYPKKLDLIGISDEITEEQAKEIIPQIKGWKNRYPNFLEPNHDGEDIIDYSFHTRLESFHSLLQSLGCEGRHAVLKEVK